MYSSAQKLIKIASYFEKKYASEQDISKEQALFSNLYLEANQEISEETVKKWIDINQSKLPILKQFNYLSDGDLTPYENMLVLDHPNRKIRIILSPNQEPAPLGNHILQQVVFNGVGNIPTLYLFVCNIPSKVEVINKLDVEVPKEIANDRFIIVALKNIFQGGAQYLRANKEQIVQFIIENNPTIDNIKKWFATSEPITLGKGIDGVAFDIGNNRVLKIFSSAAAYTKTKEAFERIKKNYNIAKTEAIIYDIGLLGSYQDINLYYYIIEKMHPVENLPTESNVLITKLLSEISAAINQLPANIHDTLNKLGGKIKYHKKHKSINRFIKNIVNFILQKIDPVLARKIISTSNVKPDFLKYLIEEFLVKHMTKRTDLTVGNIGINNQGYLRFFDPVYYDFDNL